MIIKAKQIHRSGATDNQSLVWDGSKWAPSSAPPSVPNDPSKPPARSVLDSRSGGLLTNGTGLLGSAKSNLDGTTPVLYNFTPASTFYLSRQSPLFDGRFIDGVGAGIEVSGYTFFGTETGGAFSNEIMAVNPNNVYRGGVTVIPNASAATNSRRFYAGHTFVDKNGYPITSSQHQHRGLAKLANDLNLGVDTWMYIVRDGDFLGNIDPHLEWNIGIGDATYSIRRGPIFWDHHYVPQQQDSEGNPIPFTRVGSSGDPNSPAGFGYSKHWVYDLWDSVPGQWELANDGSGAGNWNGFTNVWRHPIKTAHGGHAGHSFSPNSTATFIPQGTWLSGNFHGGTYKYCYAAGSVPADPNLYYRFEGWVGGTDYSGGNRANNFPPGSAGVVWMMLACYTGVFPVDKHYISAMSMSEDTAATLVSKQLGSVPEHTYYDIAKIEYVGNSVQGTVLSLPRFSTARRFPIA